MGRQKRVKILSGGALCVFGGVSNLSPFLWRETWISIAYQGAHLFAVQGLLQGVRIPQVEHQDRQMVVHA
jgi:hypothetical protein